MDLFGSRRAVRKRAIIARPIKGREDVYKARSFDHRASDTIVTLKPTSYGHFMRTHIPVEGITYRMRLKSTTTLESS